MYNVSPVYVTLIILWVTISGSKCQVSTCLLQFSLGGRKKNLMINIIIVGLIINFLLSHY